MWCVAQLVFYAAKFGFDEIPGNNMYESKLFFLFFVQASHFSVINKTLTKIRNTYTLLYSIMADRTSNYVIHSMK